MRNVLLGIAAVALLVNSPSIAADMPLKAPAAAPAAAFSWTGCYIGVDVGGVSDKQATSINPVNENQGAVSGSISQHDRVIAGGFYGCNYQFAPVPIVLGAEGDFSWAKLGGAATGPNLFPNGTPAGAGGVLWSSNTNWLATARGRLGVAVVPNVLLYGTGGVAWKGTDYAGLDTFNNGSFVASNFSDERSGWVAGGGAEWAPLSNHWFVRVEYLHYQFSGSSGTVTNSPTSSVTFNFGDLKIDTVRAGLGAKF